MIDLDMTDIEKHFEKKYAYKSIDCEKIRGNRGKLCMVKKLSKLVFYNIFYDNILFIFS